MPDACPTCGAEVRIVGETTKHYEAMGNDVLDREEFRRIISVPATSDRANAEKAYMALEAHDAAFRERVEELEGALEHTTRELEHWIAWKNGNAMHPQRVKGQSAVDRARQALQEDDNADRR